MKLDASRLSRLAGRLLPLWSLLPAVAAQDAERATHTDAASSPQITLDDRHEGFVLRQYELGCLSQLTYLLGSDGEAAVVDPQRDVEHYLRDAQALGLKIRYVVLTHTNADFVAGHTELAARAGAEILISADSGSEFAHRGLHDGDHVGLGAVTLEFWATPGHTLDSMTMLVHVPGAPVDPAYIVTGDTLFIGGIGRPDLVGGDVTPVVLANKAFDSMQRLKGLPDATKVLPGHGAGSLCGAHLSPETVSTLGAEKATNPYLEPLGRAAFVARVVTGLPVAPQYFKHNVALNRKGPPLVGRDGPMPAALAVAVVADAAAKGTWLVDVRDQEAYAQGHISGAVNVALRGRLDTWTGIVVPFDAPVVLVGEEDEVREASFRLRRVGYDNLQGYLAGGMAAWRAAGQPVRASKLLAPRALHAAMQRGDEPLIVDVRTPGEYEELRLGDYANIPVSDWQRFATLLDKRQPLVMVCNSAYRSSMAVGLAERQGFVDVGSLDGGLDAWLTAGLPASGSSAVGGQPMASGTAMAPGTAMALPEPIEPTALASVLADQPQSYLVLDVRPAWAYADYHVPGAVSVTPEAALAQAAAADVRTRVVFVDRDGTVAWAVAGVFSSQQPARAVRVLAGGTARFWREVELGRGGSAGTPLGQAVPAAPAPTQRAPSPPIKPATVTKKRNAGC
ncbi:MAG: rhodanese-like domain-containing protein [Planctomycetota bacterium]